MKWSEKWQMLFNFEKCKCLYAEHGNTGVNYEMGGFYILHFTSRASAGHPLLKCACAVMKYNRRSAGLILSTNVAMLSPPSFFCENPAMYPAFPLTDAARF